MAKLATLANLLSRIDIDFDIFAKFGSVLLRRPQVKTLLNNVDFKWFHLPEVFKIPQQPLNLNPPLQLSVYLFKFSVHAGGVSWQFSILSENILNVICSLD